MAKSGLRTLEFLLSTSSLGVWSLVIRHRWRLGGFDRCHAAAMITEMTNSQAAMTNSGRGRGVGPSSCLCVFAVSSVWLVLACGSKLPRLRQQLADPDPGKRIAAIQALAETRDTGSVLPIVALLKDIVPDVRREAAHGLGLIGDARACQPLADFYDREQTEDVQNAGIRALIQLDTYSTQPLIGLLRSIRPVVRAGAARALGKLHAKDAVDPLIWLLRDADENVQVAAIFALRQIGDERGLDAIASRVRDTDPDIEGAAERALSGEGYVEQLNKAKRVLRHLPYP
jgi:hypothetical protein